MRVRQNPKGSGARLATISTARGHDRAAVAPLEAPLGRVSLDRVIWIESMAEEPASRHRPLALRWRAGDRARYLLHMTEVRSDGRRLFRAHILANRSLDGSDHPR